MNVKPTSDAKPSIWDAGGQICLSIDRSIYPIDAALAAGYTCTDRAFVWIEPAGSTEDAYCVFLRPKVATDDLQALSGAFANALLDHALRRRLEQQFGNLRTLMVAQAFSEGNLLGGDDDLPEPSQRSAPSGTR